MPKAARIGDIASAHGCFPPTPIIAGSGDVFINGIAAARLGDATAPHGCPCPSHALVMQSTVAAQSPPPPAMSLSAVSATASEFASHGV
ncbi:PAAR domain-containing protein [Vibrio kasasachensis]